MCGFELNTTHIIHANSESNTIYDRRIISMKALIDDVLRYVSKDILISFIYCSTKTH